LHWVSARHAVAAEVRLYDRLFSVADPDCDGKNWREHLNAESMRVLMNCRIEPGLAAVQAEDRFQFERLGYFCADSADFSTQRPVFNRIVTLRDSWSRTAGA